MQNKYFPILLLAVFFAVGCSPKVAEVVGEDGTDYGQLAQQYRDNPAALRDYVQECERTQQDLATVRQQLTNYQSQSGDVQGQLNAAQAAAAQAQDEAAQLRQQLAAAQAQRNDEVITDQQVVSGVIFQVQLGAYAQNRVDPDLQTGDALELQDQNGLQKVVVSQFRTYSNAAALRDRLKKMGVSGAFVVAKNNGQRIDIQEALRITGQG